MYNDYYLKFTNESTMHTVINNNIQYPGCFIDIIGKIVDNPVVINSDGQIIQEATFIDGWHVNIRIKNGLPTELTSYQINTPFTPSRIWA